MEDEKIIEEKEVVNRDPNIRFAYIDCNNYTSYLSAKAGIITVAYNVNTHFIGLAFVHTKDTFNKKIGREVALKKLLINQVNDNEIYKLNGNIKRWFPTIVAYLDYLSTLKRIFPDRFSLNR